MGRRIGLVLASLAVLCCIAEVSFRIYDARIRATILHGRDPSMLATHPVEDGRIYALRPNHAGLMTNSHGFRDRDRAHRKQPGVFRIAVIGDSVTMQASLDFDELYPTLLERKLDDMLPQAEFEVLNFGVTGYGTFQQLALLKEVVLGFEPDALLWQFHLNDAVDPRVDGADAGLGRYYARPRSAFIAYLHRRWHRWQRKRTARARGLDRIPLDLQYQIYRWDEVTDALQTVSELADANGMSTWVFLYPTWPDEHWEEYTLEGFDVVGDLSTRFETLGFEALDLVAVFRREPPSRYRMTVDDPWHPNAAGHRLIADELSRWLASMVPPT